MPHTYDAQFMGYTAHSSRHSAHVITALVRKFIPAGSVLDIGCARGTWLRAWQEAGATDIFGVDGCYLDTRSLVIPLERFRAADLAQRIDLNRQFDFVQSLEVAEHIPASGADQFIENLVRHSRGIVLFSAAPPGQGGEFHVNEQPYDYWRTRFLRYGFQAYDFIRPLIAADKRISFWYRYNTFLYARGDAAASFSDNLRRTRVGDGQPMVDISPPLFRVRKRLVRALPQPVQLWLAKCKAHVMP